MFRFVFEIITMTEDGTTTTTSTQLDSKSSKSSKSGTRGYKCPCCNNPWSAATGDFFAKLCGECDTSTSTSVTAARGLDRANMDFSVLPSNNFFHYANGTWAARNPIPPGYPNWNSFLILHTSSQENLRNLLDELRDKQQKQDDDDDDDGEKSSSSSSSCTLEERKVAAFFGAAMDEETIEQQGASVLEAPLQLVDEIVASREANDTVGYAQKLGTLALKYGVRPFISLGVSPDNMNVDHSLLQLAQGGLGLPDRDYYFDDDKAAQRQAYQTTVAFMLTLLDDATAVEATDSYKEAAKAVFDLETRLAEAHMTKTENRDPHATYNKMSMDAFMASSGNGAFLFADYLQAATTKSVNALGDFNVRNVQALQRVAQVAATVQPATLRAYLRWNVVKSCAPYLSKCFVMAHFDFYEKTLSGTQEIKPRWKRVMAFTEDAVGDALGKLYCAKYFDEASKEQALKIVEQVRQALEARLQEVEWMTADTTRREALRKMQSFGVKIGYPDKWMDYSSLEIDADTSLPFMEMVFRAREFDFLEKVKEMNAATDRAKWVSAISFLSVDELLLRY